MKSKLRAGDLIFETLQSISAAPGRSAAAMLGAVIGAAVFVTTSGLTATLGQQVTSEFDAALARQIVVEPSPTFSDQDWFSSRALTRVRRLDGVVSAGVFFAPYQSEVYNSAADRQSIIEVRPIGDGAFSVLEADLVSGQPLSAFHYENGEPVAMVPMGVAERLGIVRPGLTTIEIDGKRTSVAAIFGQVERERSVLSQLLVPERMVSAERRESPVVIVRIEAGSEDGITPLIGTALAQDRAAELVISVPPNPESFRRRIESSVQNLTLGASLVALAMGAMSIANTATASIFARRAEIGLRSSLGALPRHVFAQVVAETAALGTLGGIAGSALGTVIVAAVALWNKWVFAVDTFDLLIAVCATLLAGALAGLPAARHALRIEPVDALR